MHTVLGESYAHAVRYASELHKDQLRNGSEIPYVAHLIGVSAIVLEYGGSETEAIAGLLHDAVEDQGGQPTRDEIARQFGEEVALIVDGCTDATEEDPANKPPWLNRKRAYLAHLRTESNPGILLVSMSDKLYNAEAIRTDLRTIGDRVWCKFKPGRDLTLCYYLDLLDAYQVALANLPNPGPPARLADLQNRLQLSVTTLVHEAGSPVLDCSKLKST